MGRDGAVPLPIAVQALLALPIGGVATRNNLGDCRLQIRSGNVDQVTLAAQNRSQATDMNGPTA